MRRNLLITASKFPGFDTQTQVIPFTHTVIGDRAAESGARIAIITVTSRVLEEALTIFELVRQTQVPVDTRIDPRGMRFASFWWMQPRAEDLASTYRPA